MEKYCQESLVFSRKENKKEYLIYSARTRGIHLVPEDIWKVFNYCKNISGKEISRKTKISQKDVSEILSLLAERKLVKKYNE